MSLIYNLTMDLRDIYFSQFLKSYSLSKMTRLCRLEGMCVSGEALGRIVSEVTLRLLRVYPRVVHIGQLEFLASYDRNINYLYKTREVLGTTRGIYYSNTDSYYYEYESGVKVVIHLHLVREEDYAFASMYVRDIEVNRPLTEALAEYSMELSLTGLYLLYYTSNGMVSHLKKGRRYRLCLSRDYQQVAEFLSTSVDSTLRQRALDHFNRADTYREIAREVELRHQFNRLVNPRKLAHELNLHNGELGRVLNTMRDIYRTNRTVSRELLIKEANREVGTSSAADRHHIELNSPDRS